jgi:hypothetical protein
MINYVDDPADVMIGPQDRRKTEDQRERERERESTKLGEIEIVFPLWQMQLSL